MCGIVGIKLFNDFIRKNHEDAVKKGLSAQVHRGPDAEGIYQTDSVILGHNRLAIVDKKERSNQPMTDVSGRYQLVFNGEIYNFADLKNELLSKNIHFNTSSDTEVLLYFLIEHGSERLDELDGCFAFAFYDSREDEFIIARDHHGINPLLFSLTDEGLFFSSELWFFNYLEGFDELNHQAINEYFQFTYIAAPNTVLKGVQKLMPGHFLQGKGKYFDIKKYTEVKQEEVNAVAKDPLAVGKRLIEDAVIKRLVADVPVGTFLSGGMDSSIVSAIAAEYKSNLKTFSIGFSDSPYHDESRFAQQVAKHIGSMHYPIMLSNKQVLDELPHVLSAFDEPFADSSAIAMYFLAQETSKEVTVSLSGDGADELFGGYNKHRAFVQSMNQPILLGLAAKIGGVLPEGDRHSSMGNRIRQLQRFNELNKLKWPENYWFLASFFSPEFRKKLLQHSAMDIPMAMQEKEPTLGAFLRMDQRFVLQGDMLKKVDLMSMRHSLEVRTPFVDKAVVQFANSLSSDYKIKGNEGKVFLRQAFADRLPADIFSRKKQGFEVPLLAWIKEAWSTIVNEIWFETDYIVEQEIFNATFVQTQKQQFFSNKPGESALFIWAYIVFQSWYQQWKRKK